MKKVNLEKTEVLKVSDLNDTHIIGVQSLRHKYKVVKLNKMATKANKICYQLLDIGSNNETTYCTGDSIKSIIKNLNTHLNIEVFVFDNTQEFYGWLAEDESIEINPQPLTPSSN